MGKTDGEGHGIQIEFAIEYKREYKKNKKECKNAQHVVECNAVTVIYLFMEEGCYEHKRKLYS